MNPRLALLRWYALVMLLVFAVPAASADNVIVVTLDGLRWQEAFGSAEDSRLNSQFSVVRDLRGLKKRYWHNTPQARREALMLFFWGTVAKQGQVFGHPAKKAAARLTNGHKFSYPGYSELFCGVADPLIDSNAKKDTPNLSVLEFLD